MGKRIALTAAAALLALTAGCSGTGGGGGNPVTDVFSKRAVNYVGQAMAPTIKPGTKIMVDYSSYEKSAPARGDIVAVQQQTLLILRVVGLLGERVSMVAGTVSIDGKPLEEPHAQRDDSDVGTITLGADDFYVLGDDRAKNADSRSFGPVKRAAIVGEVSP